MSDKCEWYDSGDYWFAECGESTLHEGNFVYCPYCGRPIKFVDEEPGWMK